MSRLLNPGLGDYADRLSILDLKIAAAHSTQSPADHFLAERAEIRKRFRPEHDARYPALATVNRDIWDRVAAIETVGQHWPYRVTEAEVYLLAEHAVWLQIQNRNRAELIRQISGAETPKEKL